MGKKAIPFAILGFIVLDESEKLTTSVKTELDLEDLKDIEDILETKLLVSSSEGKIVIYPALIPPQKVGEYLKVFKMALPGGTKQQPPKEEKKGEENPTKGEGIEGKEDKKQKKKKRFGLF